LFIAILFGIVCYMRYKKNREKSLLQLEADKNNDSFSSNHSINSGHGKKFKHKHGIDSMIEMNTRKFMKVK
jgi:hypothetical protein